MRRECAAKNGCTCVHKHTQCIMQSRMFARAHTHSDTQTQTHTDKHTQTHADINSLENDDRCRMSARFAFSRSASAAADTRGIAKSVNEGETSLLIYVPSWHIDLYAIMAYKKADIEQKDNPDQVF